MQRALLICLFSLSLFSMPTISAENTIIAGSTIKVKMAEQIDSRVRKAGYRFNVTIAGDITRDKKVIIKSGSQAQAVINKIKKSGRGQAAPEIIVTLTALRANNRQVNIVTHPIAGKGSTNERKQVGEIDENEYVVIDQQGEKITASIPLQSKGYDFILSEGTTLYFILKEPIAL